MKHDYKQPALLALLLLTCNIGFAYIIPWELSIQDPTRLPQVKASFFEVAITHAEQMVTDISLEGRPAEEHLENALKFHNILQEAAFLLMSEDLQKTAIRLREETHSLAPNILKCGRMLSTYADQYYVIQAFKIATAATLYYFDYTGAGIFTALIPPQLLSSLPLQELTTCETLWTEEGLSTSDAQSINAKISELMQTTFFTAAVLKMKYEDLANLPWETSDTWGAREWRDVETIFEKIQILLISLHQQLLGNAAESIYTERFKTMSS